MQNWWFAIFGAIALGIFAFNRLRNEPTRRAKIHRLLLRMPLFGARHARRQHRKVHEDLEHPHVEPGAALEALRISASVIANLPMREAVDEAAVRVREGGAIGRSLAQSKLFPAMSIHLISSGEASGELDAMLERTANDQESEMDSLLRHVERSQADVDLVMMGVVVLAIVMAILLPIFQINQLVQ